MMPVRIAIELLHCANKYIISVKTHNSEAGTIIVIGEEIEALKS